jgi:hypothetical protein
VAEVVSFVGYQPPQRFDAIPWTEVRIEEASAEGGTYTLIDTVALTPVDPDPADPAYRSFTTELGTAIDYWYRVLFADATGDVSQPTTPIQNSMAVTSPTPGTYGTVEELFRRLKIRTATAEQTDAADRILVAASGEVNAKMGRSTGLAAWELALATEVTLERGAELWNESEVPFGAIGLDNPSGPVFVSRHSRALGKLGPLAESWGVS